MRYAATKWQNRARAVSVSEKNFLPTAIMLIQIKASYLSRVSPSQRIGCESPETVGLRGSVES
jgi:hypothetical protein